MRTKTIAERQMADRSELSDEDQDIDIESDEDDACSTAGITFLTEADKKKHHNALERKRRDHIKDSFIRLRDAIPNCKKEKTHKLAENREKTESKSKQSSRASRAQILKEATEYIQYMSQKNSTVQKDIEQIRKQNNHLKQQVAKAESAKANGSFAPSDNLRLDDVSNDFADDSESSDGSDSAEFLDRGYKKMKIRHN